MADRWTSSALPLPWRTPWPLVEVTVHAGADGLREFASRLAGVAYPLERVLLRICCEPGAVEGVRAVVGSWRGGVEVLAAGTTAWANPVARWQRARPSTRTVAWTADLADRYAADAFRRLAAAALDGGTEVVRLDREAVPTFPAAGPVAGSGVDVRISVAVMYHPRRRDVAAKLAQDCAPLSAVLVPDPDPEGPPNALRTTRCAWAAVPDWATHHVVLQDDVVPVEDFADHLRDAVAAAPTATLSLYSNSHSRNGAMARHAAVRGGAWARLLPDEYTPTLGVVMPVDRARRYGAYLRGVPPAATSDDDVMTDFLRTTGAPALQVVPNLVQHDDGPSLVGTIGFHQGPRRSACFVADQRELPPDRFRASLGEVTAVDGHPLVLVQEGHAQVFFRQPDLAEAYGVEQPRHWPEACDLLGDDLARHLRDGLVEHRATAPPVPAEQVSDEVVREVWAACFLVGHTARRWAGPTAPAHPAVLRATVESWLGAGLPGMIDPAAGAGVGAPLVALGVAAIERGLTTAVRTSRGREEP